MPTNIKRHDKDKYYHLAKDQGYRARSAFKLIQINKRFEFLQNARVCIDLCAAPGGWCQVAAQLMPKGSLVLGVDILPIRAIRGVKTLVNDITTAECRRNIATELSGWKADVVLCDGAPNIGSSYHKDAFVQNELVLAALKTATDHLVKGGTFCTKVYRSVDYNSLMWVFQQLFEDVQAIKPNSSRSQSSEIFIVCLKYTKPDKIDPKLLDVNHIFKEVADPGLAKVDVLHKKYDKLNKRHRTGYDWEGGLLQKEYSISDFISHNEPVRILTDYNALIFATPECEKYRTNQYTTDLVLESFKDLRVLGKIDFKKILKWRQRMREWDTMMAADKVADGATTKQIVREPEKEETEDQIYEDIMELRAKAAHEERRLKKKEKRAAAKERERQRLGMSANAFDGNQEDMDLFSFSTTGKGRKLVESALEKYGDEAVAESSESEEEPAAPSELGKQKRSEAIFTEENLDGELEDDYINYKRTRKTKDRESRGNKLDAADDEMLANKLLEERRREDGALSSRPSKGQLRQEKEEREAYLELLSKGSRPEKGSARDEHRAKKGLQAASESEDSSDESTGDQEDQDDEASKEDSDEQEDDAVLETVDDDVERILSGRKSNQRNDEWFAHPIFKQTLVSGEGEDEEDWEELDEEEEIGHVENGKSSQKRERLSQAAQDMLNMMPKTDKQKRAEKRKKDTERNERKKARRDALLSDADLQDQFGHHIAAASTSTAGKVQNDEEDDDAEEAAIRKNPEIQAGMGNALKKKQKETDGFEVVPRDSEEFAAMRKDPNRYDSDDEQYTAKERAEQLALGTLMLRRSRKKALVDASYNRFTWNDPAGLPSWFLDDERQHNKPQVPIPPALLEQIKSKFQMTGTKSVKKVEEALARRKKRAALKLKAAKKSATALAENNEMSEKQKLRAIQKAMKTSKVERPGKVYVVSRRSKGASSASKVGSGKGQLKFVDKRMRADMRGMKATEKRQKKGRKK